MGNGIDIDATEDNIQNAFQKKNKFTVPDYQRPYSWGEEQWSDFWTDLKTLPEGDTHFLGSIVVIKHEKGWNKLNEMELVDGQQRLTTISVLLSAIREYYEDKGDPKGFAEKIDREYLYESNSENEMQSKLSLSRFDGDDYENILNGRQNQVDESSQLLQAYKFFRKKIDNLDSEEVNDIRGKLVGSMTIVVVECESAGSAFRLFETLNDRGMELSAVDLMKNTLLQTAAEKYQDGSESNDYKDIREQWEYLLTNVVHEISHPDRFFRHFMMSRPEPDIDESVTSRRLYDEFKDVIQNRIPQEEITLKDYIDEMVAEADTYLGIVRGTTDEFDSRIQKKINNSLQNLNDIRSSHSRTLILRTFDEFSDEPTKVLSVLRLLEVFMTRWQIADLQTGAKLDDIFADLCSNAFNEEDPIEAIREQLEEAAPNDKEFYGKLANGEFKRNNKTRYILDIIERRHYMSSGSGKTYNRASVDIEHIAPQQLFSADKYNPWEDVIGVEEGEFNNQYRNRIGNLTLLEDRLNAKASDNPFQQKKDQYRLSDFQMTQKVREEYDEWTVEEIDKRSKTLAEIGVEIWNFDTYPEEST